MKLIGMMDSPYVRRVAVSLTLYGIEFESQPLSVFSTFDAFSQQNPVVKAPTLVLDDGTLLMDSTLILNYFESVADASHTLLPQQPLALAEDLQLLGFILAASEKAVQYVYEHRLRPAEKQHQPWIERVTRQLLAACRAWEGALESRPPGDKADQVAIGSTVVWTFIQRMIPEVVAAAEYPLIQRVSDRFEAQPAFQRYPHG
nr:glutathione S-transferase [uncultured Erwinia sp.]